MFFKSGSKEFSSLSIRQKVFFKSGSKEASSLSHQRFPRSRYFSVHKVRYLYYICRNTLAVCKPGVLLWYIFSSVGYIDAGVLNNFVTHFVSLSIYVKVVHLLFLVSFSFILVSSFSVCLFFCQFILFKTLN
jgi:hypothetical protein